MVEIKLRAKGSKAALELFTKLLDTDPSFNIESFTPIIFDPETNESHRFYNITISERTQ